MTVKCRTAIQAAVHSLKCVLRCKVSHVYLHPYSLLQNEDVNNVFKQKTITYRRFVFMYIHWIEMQGVKLVVIVGYFAFSSSYAGLEIGYGV